jgi:hypothetical protein
MKNRKETQVKEDVGFRQIRDVKPSRKIYSGVEIYRARKQGAGVDLRISEAAVELIAKGLEAEGIEIKES